MEESVCNRSLKGLVVGITLIQLICSIIGVIVVVVYGLAKIGGNLFGSKNASKVGEVYQIGYFRLGGGAIIIFLLIFTIISLILAKLLYAGVHNAEKKKCLIWIVANVIILTLFVAIILNVWIWIVSNQMKLPIVIVVLTFIPPIPAYGIFLVFKFWRQLSNNGDMETQRNSGDGESML